MKHYLTGGAMVFCLLTLLYVPPAQADTGLCCLHCGGNMPLNILGAGIPETHEFRLKIKPMHMSMRGLQGSGSLSTEAVLSVPGSMSLSMDANIMAINNRITGELTGRKYMAAPQRMYMNMYDISAAYSFSDRFAAMLMTMYQEKYMKMKFNYMMRNMLGRSHYTMKTSGMSDTMLIGKYRVLEDDSLAPTNQLSVIAGLSLPTGSIDEKNRNHPLGNPTAPLNLTDFNSSFPDRRSEPMPYSMQLGSGTFDPVAGLAYQGSASPYWWGATLLYTGRAYRNKHNYSLGDFYRLDVYAMYQLLPSLVAHIQWNSQWQGALQGEHEEAYRGDAGRATDGNIFSEYMSPAWDPDNYGGEIHSITAGIQWQPVPLQVLELSVAVPVVQRFRGIQMPGEYTVQLAYYVEIPTSSSVRHSESSGQPDSLGF